MTSSYAQNNITGKVINMENIFQFKVLKASARRIESLEIKKLFVYY